MRNNSVKLFSNLDQWFNRCLKDLSRALAAFMFLNESAEGNRMTVEIIS